MGSGNADENTELITKGVVQEIDPATGLPAMAPDVVENGVSKTMWIFWLLQVGPGLVGLLFAWLIYLYTGQQATADLRIEGASKGVRNLQCPPPNSLSRCDRLDTW